MLRTLAQAGVQIRCFNPPGFESPLGWLSRNHRKTLMVDGRIGFVSGLCIGDAWMGDPDAASAKPWRDTGVAIEGPVLNDLEAAFRHSWNAAGPALERLEAPDPAPHPLGLRRRVDPADRGPAVGDGRLPPGPADRRRRRRTGCG